MPIKKKGRKYILQHDVVSKIASLNLNEKCATIENITKELCQKITIEKIIKQHPTIVKQLLSNAIAEGKVYQLNIMNDNNNENSECIIDHRTPRMIRDNERKFIQYYDGHIPGTSYFNLLKHCFAFERDNGRLHSNNKSDGFTIEEIYTYFNTIKKIYLNYSLEQFKNKLIPAALKNGHVERLNSTKYFITQSFRNTYDLYRRNRKQALISIGETCENDEDDDDEGSAAAANDSSSFINEKNNDNDDGDGDGDDEDDGDNSNNQSNDNDSKTNANQSLKKSSGTLITKISSKNFSFKTNEIKSRSTTMDLQPQRVSQRKKIRKTLGPDFLDSYSEKAQSNSIIGHHQKSSSTKLSLKLDNVQSSSTTTINVENNLDNNNNNNNNDDDDDDDEMIKSPIDVKKNRRLSICLICCRNFKSPRQARIFCSVCSVVAHGKCFRSYVNKKNGIIRMICSTCRPESICFMCNIDERNPEMFVQCVKCLSTYHVHCFREKAHSLCQKCKNDVINGNISHINDEQESKISTNDINSVLSTSSSSSSSTSSSFCSSNIRELDSKPLTSSTIAPTTVVPKVTIAPIKSTKNLPTVSNGNNISGKSLISGPMSPSDKNKQMMTSKSMANSLMTSLSNLNAQKDSKKIKDEPMEVDQIMSATTTSVSKLDNNLIAPISSTKNIAETTKSNSILNNNNNNKSLLTTVASSTASTTTTTTAATRKRKHNDITSFEIWNKKPSQSICYNFQTWLDTELRHNCKRYGPDVDLTPLLSLSNTITEWTSENVHCFLATLGFNEEADIFLMKDINGLSLMLLTRYDFLYSLSIKTGPAIRLLGIVNRLHEEL